MNTDSAFAIGKRHEVCQDYTQTEIDGGWARVFVSDGCSSSKDSDIGSRLLVLSAKQSIRAMLDSEADPFSADPNDMGLVAISGAMMSAKVLDLPLETLDATLLSIVTNGEQVLLSAFGDGVLVLTWDSSRRRCVDIEFPNGYPDYLSYRIDKGRRAKYDKLYQGGIARISEYGGELAVVEETKGIELHRAYEETFHCVWGTNRLVTAAVLSDGVRSFYKRSESGANEPVPLDEVLGNLLDFKLFSGRFVQRRLNRFLKDAAARGWEHHDDIAVAAIYFGE